MFTVERLQTANWDQNGPLPDQAIPIGSVSSEDGLHDLLEDRFGEFVIHLGDARVRWDLEPVCDGPHRDEYRKWFRLQLGEIVKALRGEV